MTANPLLPHEAVILDVRRETRDTATFTLAFKDPARQENFSFQPGQFNVLSVLGLGEVPISFSSAPSRSGTFQHTLRGVGNVTEALVRLGVGAVVGVRGPYGHPWPIEEARGNHVLVVAGGIGLAPLRPVVEHVLAHADDFHSLTVLYGAKTPADLVFTADFARWEAGPGARLLLTVDRTDGQAWPHRVGVVPVLFEEVSLPPASTIALLCGPEVMMRFVLLELLKRGFAPPRIFLSMERRMGCGIAQCGHCFFGPKFVCKDGPVFRYTDVQGLLGKGV